MKAEFVASDDGDDLRVINAARVSFQKESKGVPDPTVRVFCGPHPMVPTEADVKLLKYLADHNHFTPFTHCRITFKDTDGWGPIVWIPGLKEVDRAGLVWDDTGMFRHSLYGWANLLRKGLVDSAYCNRIAYHLHQVYPASSRALQVPEGTSFSGNTVERVLSSDDPEFIDVTLRECVPIFVARQRFKHMVGFTYNEVSRRYVDDQPEFYSPETWRKRPVDNKKQGSSDEVIEEPEIWIPGATTFGYKNIVNLCAEWYEAAIRKGVAPEQARMVLPQSMYTEYYTTGSLAAWARAYKLRVEGHAQKEIQTLAAEWGRIIGDIKGLEHSWQALTG